MGFTNGTGPEGTPTFNNSPQTVVDLTKLRDLVIERGNRFKGTTAQRNTFTTAGYAAEGVVWYDTTLGVELIRRGGAWKRTQSFRSFTLARSSMNDATMFFQTMSEETAKASAAAFSYAYASSGSDQGKITPEAGIYLVNARLHPGSAATGLTYVQIRSTEASIARGLSVVNADPWAYGSAIFRGDGSIGFWVEMYKTTGTSSNGNGFLTIERLGDL